MDKGEKEDPLLLTAKVVECENLDRISLRQHTITTEMACQYTTHQQWCLHRLDFEMKVYNQLKDGLGEMEDVFTYYNSVRTHEK